MTADNQPMAPEEPRPLPAAQTPHCEEQPGAAYAALPDAPLSVFSKGPWVFKETGQDFSGAELDEAAFVAYREHASHGQAPAGAVLLDDDTVFLSGKAAGRQRNRPCAGKGRQMSNEPMPAQGPVDVTVSDLAEAIKHATEVADREGCTECGQQHRKLAAWLMELQGAKSMLPLYREVVGRIVTAADPRASLQDMRCWWDKEKKLRIAMDLPDREGRAFLGR